MKVTETDLLYGVDGDPCRTRDYEMTVLDVRPNLIQNEGDDVGFHSQEQHITLTDGLLVASCQVHPHFLHKKTKREVVMVKWENVKRYGPKNEEGGKQVSLQQHTHHMLSKPTLTHVFPFHFSFPDATQTK